MSIALTKRVDQLQKEVAELKERLEALETRKRGRPSGKAKQDD